MLSVIVPIYNEEKYIDQCIYSILEQDYPKDDLEVIFVDGMSDDRTCEIVQEYIWRYPFIRLLDNPKRIAPCAMNIGIRVAKGDVIIRLDAHASYENNYFSALVKALTELQADNVGAACLTDVLHKTSRSLAIREVLSNHFGVGNSTFRLGVTEVMEVDTVPFGCWPRIVFDKYGMYDERLVRNQDFELNRRITRGGGRIYIIPDTHCTYYARETFKALAKQGHANGKWNILTVYFTGTMSSLALRHYVPLLFLLSLIVPVLAAFVWPPISLLAVASLLCYVGLIGGISTRIALEKHLNLAYLVAAFTSLHFSYGAGSLVGALKTLATRK